MLGSPSYGLLFSLRANSSDGWLIGRAAPLPRTGPRVRAAERCWIRRGTFHGPGMQSPGATATRLPGFSDVGPTRVAPWVFVAEVLPDVGF